MSKFKHAALALAAASLMAVQAHATEVQAQSPQAMPVATFSQADINTMFDQAGQPMQLAALSGQEMKDTEGAWWFVPVAAWAFGGAAVGGVQHVWRTGSTSGLWRGIGAGATGGLYASPFGRTVFGAHNFARWTIGGFGGGSWYR
jgi:hypothetical protein